MMKIVENFLEKVTNVSLILFKVSGTFTSSKVALIPVNNESRYISCWVWAICSTMRLNMTTVATHPKQSD